MMDLLEKAIKGLEVCREMDNPPGWRCTDCVECPYHENGCARKLKEDSLQLLQRMKDENRASESQELSPAGSAGGQIGQEEKEHGDAGKGRGKADGEPGGV